jgi:hypothetical protein
MRIRDEVEHELRQRADEPAIGPAEPARIADGEGDSLRLSLRPGPGDIGLGDIDADDGRPGKRAPSAAARLPVPQPTSSMAPSAGSAAKSRKGSASRRLQRPRKRA